MLDYSQAQFNRALGFVLRSSRRKAGLTQEDAAKGAELHRAYLARLERGHHSAGLWILMKLGDCYGCPGDELLKRIIRRAAVGNGRRIKHAGAGGS
jgi:transcriptional regulator with XRE-family HTH domain